MSWPVNIICNAHNGSGKNMSTTFIKKKVCLDAQKSYCQVSFLQAKMGHSEAKWRKCLQPFDVGNKVIHPKHSKHWLSTLANTFDSVCSKILNHGLNHGLLFSLFMYFRWKNILN